jgi:RNA polymerase sigma-32 factor
MYQTLSQPLPSIGTGLAHYLAEIRKFPILTQEEETAFARRCATKAIARQLIAL